MTCRRCQHQACQRFGYFGKRRIQRWRCTSCKSTFCEPHTKLTRATMFSQPDLAARAIECLLERCSIRSTERLTGLNRNTIMRLLILARHRSERLMDTMMRGCSPGFCRWMKSGRSARRNSAASRKGESPEVGDPWVYVAIDAETKLIPSFYVGKRSRPDTTAFLWDLNQRLANRVQLTTDGLNP